MSNAREYFERMYRPELRRAGTHFLCNACLVHRPKENLSLDGRYCRECYDFLEEEASQDTSRRKVGWKPSVLRESLEKTVQAVVGVRGIVSTLTEEETTVDLIRPSVVVGKRGRKHRDLPHDLIRQWESEDMGSKSIATRLKAEQGIVVSYKTIQRVLSGERVTLR